MEWAELKLFRGGGTQAPMQSMEKEEAGERESQREIARSADVLPWGPWLTTVGAKHAFKHSAFQHLGRTGRD